MTAVLGGPAFSFGYAEHVELLAAAGAEVVLVDPLRDEVLPEGTAGLVLPGGFPEEHVAALGANVPLLRAIRDLAAAGAPIRAECGGLLYLCRELDGVPLVGALDATAAMTGRLTLGYRDAVALTDSSGFAAGTRVAGHEFHHCAVTPRAGTAVPSRAGSAVTPGAGSVLTPGAVTPGAGSAVTPGAGRAVPPGAGRGVTPGVGSGVATGVGSAGAAGSGTGLAGAGGSAGPRVGAAAWGWRGAQPEGFVVGGVHASFLHTHPAGDPSAVARFVAAAAGAL